MFWIGAILLNLGARFWIGANSFNFGATFWIGANFLYFGPRFINNILANELFQTHRRIILHLNCDSKSSKCWTLIFSSSENNPTLIQNPITHCLDSYSYGSPKVSRFSWRHKTILVAARPETWQFSSRSELHFSLLGEKLSILVATCCYEAPQYLLIPSF